MSNGTGFCANCGGERGIHHYQTDQCPVGGVESPISRKQEWKTSTFVDIPFDPPVRLAKDMTLREHFAAMALQGVMSADIQDQLTYQQIARQAVKAADALIEDLKQASDHCEFVASEEDELVKPKQPAIPL